MRKLKIRRDVTSVCNILSSSAVKSVPAFSGEFGERCAFCATSSAVDTASFESAFLMFARPLGIAVDMMVWVDCSRTRSIAF